MRVLAALLFLVAACATPARSDPRADIEALEQAWHAGASASQLEEILAEDFRRPMASGEVWTRERQLAWLRDRPAPPGFTARLDPLVVQIEGDVAIATGVAALIDPTGREVDRNVFTDVYVRRDGRWRMLSAQRTQVVR